MDKATDKQEPGPLHGIRVLDLTRVLGKVLRFLFVFKDRKKGQELTLPTRFLIFSLPAGPYCTQLLGDLGYVLEQQLGQQTRAAHSNLRRETTCTSVSLLSVP